MYKGFRQINGVGGLFLIQAQEEKFHILLHDIP